jgi:hypothetical protein
MPQPLAFTFARPVATFEPAIDINDLEQNLLFDPQELYDAFELLDFRDIKQEDLVQAFRQIRECCLNVIVGVRFQGKVNSTLYIEAISRRNRLMLRYHLSPRHISDFDLMEDLTLRVELMNLTAESRLVYYTKRLRNRQQI